MYGYSVLFNAIFSYRCSNLSNGYSGEFFRVALKLSMRFIGGCEGLCLPTSLRMC